MLPSLRAALAALFLTGILTAAQSQTVPRITQPLHSAPRIPILNTLPARIQSATDLGTAPATLPVTNVTLRFNLTSAQSAALDALTAAQQNPASPLYHLWLTPEQYGATFGLPPADLAQITGWLAQQGLTITDVSRGRTSISVSGTVAQFGKAFAAPLHLIRIDGEQHLAPLTDPTLPTPIAAVVGTITGLTDLHPRPRVHPRFTSAANGQHFIAPGDFYTLYDVSPLLAANITGSGITIAVAGQTDLSLADVAAFRSASGLPANPPHIQLFGADPGTRPADLPEAQLDVEWTGAVAPAATILYVNSTDALTGSLANAIANNLAPIVTVSYGDCEAATGAATIATFNQLFRQANVQGQTIIAPSGDSGATDCDFNVTSATHGLAVDFPASSPFVTALGGTMFAEGALTYWSATNNTNAGSALSYIPEAAWNETSLTGTLSAGGGGPSAVFPKPSWQTGPGVPADSSRDLPDISFSAAANHDGYLICASGSCTNGFRSAAGTLQVVGGTSVSTPSFAAVLALLEQKIQARVANANPTLYALANSRFSTSIFHDVTTGSNAEPCTAGSAGCPSGGTLGFNATPGFDLATGLGSVDTFTLVNSWSLVTPAAVSPTGTNTSATTLTSPSTSVPAGTQITLTASVTSATSTQTATPTGTIQLLIDGTSTGTPTTLATGTATIPYTTTALTPGSHILTAVYSGDSVYLGSKGVFSNLTITSTSTPDFALTTNTSTLAVASGGISPGIILTLTPSNGFTGPVSVVVSSVPTNLAATTSFSANPVTLTGGTPGTTIFTLVASTPLTGKLAWPLTGSAIAFATLLCLSLPRRNRLTRPALIGAAITISLISASGCSGHSSTSTTGTPVTKATPGTYTLTLTASGTTSTGTRLVHQTNITLTVQ